MNDDDPTEAFRRELGEVGILLATLNDHERYKLHQMAPTEQAAIDAFGRLRLTGAMARPDTNGGVEIKAEIDDLLYVTSHFRRLNSVIRAIRNGAQGTA
jgi:hypothetical protein